MLSNFLYILISVILIFPVFSIAQAVEFDARDVRIDLHLPVLDTPNNAISPDMTSDNNGHVYIVWSDNWGGTAGIYVNTFLPDKGWIDHATQVNTGFPMASYAQMGEASSPRVCSDNSGHIYVVWVDDRAEKAGTGKKDIYFRYSKDYGFSWYPEFTDIRIDTEDAQNIVGDSLNPQLACDDSGNIYVVWEDNRNNPRKYEVYFRSLQVQFSKPTDFIVYHQTPDIRINTGVNAGKHEAIGPAISTDKNGNVYVAWSDYRTIFEENIYPGIYFNMTKNHGIKWLSESKRIDVAPLGGYQFFSPPVINSDQNGNVYVAWLDNAGRSERGDPYAADGTSDVYFTKSNDFGVTWLDEDIRIEKVETQADATGLAMASNNKGVIAIVWADDRDEGNNIYVNHSENFGRSFLDMENNIRLNTETTPQDTLASSPAVQIDSYGNIFVVWSETYGAVANIYLNFSAEKGTADSWQTSALRVDYPTPGGNSKNPRMSADNNGNVYVVWEDDRAALAKDNYNIFFISGFLNVETLLIGGQRLGEECFIATAAYGSPFESHVMILREFRDRYLMTNSPGQWLVSLYYHLSPPIADFISGHSYLKGMVRITLLPVVGIAMLTLHTTIIQKVMLILLTVSVIVSVSFIIYNCRQ